MLLSSVNFVAKPKSGKGCKGKEEKKEEKKKVEPKETVEGGPDVCLECRRESAEENTIFRFPTPSQGSRDSFKTSGYVSLERLDSSESIGDRVTIATGDDLCLSVDQFYYTIGLKDESRSDSTCTFRKRVLESSALPNGHLEKVVFVLDCDQDFYITTTNDKNLELNFFAIKPTADTDDERTFLVYFTDLGQTLIQPKQHKNFYLHHIDSALSVQQLDLNWRCPEEYFFHFNAVPEPIVLHKVLEKKICTHKTVENNNDANKKVCSHDQKKEKFEKIPDRFITELPKDKACKNKKFLSNLFMGCFSARSHELTQTEV